MISPEEKQAIREKYNYRPFKEAPPSKAEVELLPLETIDLSKYDEGPEARKQLAQRLEKALTEYGFFRLVNHGFSPEFLETMKSISQSTFETSEEVKAKFLAGKNNIELDDGLELGVIRGTGYKPRGYWTYTNETKDNVEFFNVRHFNFHEVFNSIEHPEFVKANLDDIEFYFTYLHQQIQRKVLNLIDIILGLPEGEMYKKYFRVEYNDPNDSGTGFGRFLLYHPVDEDYNRKTTSTWMRGHTDAGAFTYILSQPILSLQVRTYDDYQWKYVGHVPNSIIVNAGDTIKFLTAGYFKSAVHRVHTAPQDQKDCHRNTIIYFASPKLDIYMDPETLNSPKLTEKGYTRDKSIPKVTIREWDEAKGKFFNKKSANWVTNIVILGRECVGSLIGEKAIKT